MILSFEKTEVLQVFTNNKNSSLYSVKRSNWCKNILDREHEIHEIVWPRLLKIDNLHVLAENISERLGIYSFYIDDLHFNLVVQLLNDRFGIQVRGGCSCAGTYGHILLEVDKKNFSQNN